MIQIHRFGKLYNLYPEDQRKYFLYPPATYTDEPATRETFVANVQAILEEATTELPNGKRPVVECMERLSRELRKSK
jgi:hypothetical protein